MIGDVNYKRWDRRLFWHIELYPAIINREFFKVCEDIEPNLGAPCIAA